jgi:hypothetical protein
MDKRNKKTVCQYDDSGHLVLKIGFSKMDYIEWFRLYKWGFDAYKDKLVYMVVNDRSGTCSFDYQYTSLLPLKLGQIKIHCDDGSTGTEYYDKQERESYRVWFMAKNQSDTKHVYRYNKFGVERELFYQFPNSVNRSDTMQITRETIYRYETW